MGWGDEIMVSGRARVLQAADSRKVRVLFQGAPRWNAIWDHNPRIARLNERGDFQPLHARNKANLRPYHAAKTAARWSYNPGFRADAGEIYLTDVERAFAADLRAPCVIVEPHIKDGASPNKQWGWVRWNKLAWLLQREGLRVTQLGPPGTETLEGADLIQTPSFRDACAALERARAAVLPEGGLHHAAAALGVPAVVIFGGFTPVELTGYGLHVNLGVSVDTACGLRVPCEHCAEAMAQISPELVAERLLDLLAQRKESHEGMARPLAA